MQMMQMILVVIFCFSFTLIAAFISRAKTAYAATLALHRVFFVCDYVTALANQTFGKVFVFVVAIWIFVVALLVLTNKFVQRH
jgi:hypothetical protein